MHPDTNEMTIFLSRNSLKFEVNIKKGKNINGNLISMLDKASALLIEKK